MTDNEVRQLLAAFNDQRVEVAKSITRLEEQVVDLEDKFKIQIRGLEEKIEGLRSTNRWIARSVGGVLIGIVIPLLVVLAGKGLP